jgi:outer membrane protein TolC
VNTAIVVVTALLFAPAADGVLTLDDTLALAKSNNFDIAAARARLAEAKVGIEQAWVALQPTAATQGRYTHNYKTVQLNLIEFQAGALGLGALLKQVNADSPPNLQNPALGPAIDAFRSRLEAQSQPIQIQKEEQLDASANVAVPLIVPSAYFGLAAAHSQFAAAQANYDFTEQNLLYAVAQTFYAVAGADELLVARQNAVTVAQQTLERAQASLSAGTAKRTDVNQAELALLRAQQSLRQAGDDRDRVHRSLATLVQVPEPINIDTSAPIVINKSVTGLVEDAFALRPDLRASRAGIDSAHDQQMAALLRWSPTLSGFGNAHVGNYVGFSGDYYSWAIGLQLDWTIYDGGARIAAGHLADAQLAEDEANVSSISATVADDVRNALSAAETKRAAVATAEASVNQADDTLALMRVQVDAGTSLELELLQAQDALVEAEVSLAQARFDLALAMLALEHASGHAPGTHL